MYQMSVSFCIAGLTELVNECTSNFVCVFLFVVSVLANEDLLKSVLQCSVLQISHWKVDHPSDTEEDITVGLSNEDEAEGLEPTPRVARHGSSGHAPVPSVTSCS